MELTYKIINSCCCVLGYYLKGRRGIWASCVRTTGPMS
jgi:hypothetical protein